MTALRTVSADGQRLRVAVRPGTDTGRIPLLLSNRIGATLNVLDPFVEALDPAVEVIRSDAPGVGGSPVPPLPYPFARLARLVGRMLDRLGYQRFDVLGISWGGGLAQQLAFQNPRRCRRLILVSTATGWMMVPARPRVLLRMATPLRYWDADYAREIAGDIYGGELRRRPDLVRHLLAGDRPASGRAYLYQLAAGAGWTSLPFLPLIWQPTLILAGDDDPIIPLVNARVMARLLPAARLNIYPDGHLGLLTMKDELAGEVTRFIGEPLRAGERRRRGHRTTAGRRERYARGPTPFHRRNAWESARPPEHQDLLAPVQGEGHLAALLGVHPLVVALAGTKQRRRGAAALNAGFSVSDSTSAAPRLAARGAFQHHPRGLGRRPIPRRRRQRTLHHRDVELSTKSASARALLCGHTCPRFYPRTPTDVPGATLERPTSRGRAAEGAPGVSGVVVSPSSWGLRP